MKSAVKVVERRRLFLPPEPQPRVQFCPRMGLVGPDCMRPLGHRGLCVVQVGARQDPVFGGGMA